MELKKYQLNVLKDLDLYIEELNTRNNLYTAFSSFWAKKGVILNTINTEYVHPYNNLIKGVPNVTIKVPTAGGKTFIACKAISHIFKCFPDDKPKVVVWFVPSDSILKQTYARLSNPLDPYRRAIDIDFGNKVQVVNKESALIGDNIHPAQIKENLTIFVLSVQSFASNNKEGRKSRRENENLVEHVPTFTFKNKMIDSADETSLLQVIAQLNPVVIIDESHNFEADLRIDLKQEINPSFIFNLTATPRENSNIISFVDAMQLKKEHMVKLPVIVYNHKSSTDVIANAINLQRNLENKAIEQRKSKNARYIRPIVLFQAQPKNDNDNVTFEKIKQKLILAGIPEEQVKIKTANVDEISKLDLMSETCEVRYIITINALKEGWDCPFAYILASVANKNSKIDIEQLLGRILRLPYTQSQSSDLLNLSYVFTCSSDFQTALKDIVCSLNRVGYSKRDYRVASPISKHSTQDNEDEKNLFTSTENVSISEMTDSDNHENISNNSIEGTENVPEATDFNNQESDTETSTAGIASINSDETSDLEIDSEAIKDSIQYGSEDTISSLETVALEQSEEYNSMVSDLQNGNESPLPNDLDMNKFTIKEVFAKFVKDIRLPIFVQKNESIGLFGTTSGYSPIEKSDLLEEIDLSLEDHKIDFTRSKAEVEQIDLQSDNIDDTDSVPIHKVLNDCQLHRIQQQLLSFGEEGKKTQLAGSIARRLNIKEIPEKMLTEYIYDCLKNRSNEELNDLITYELQTIETIKTKINSILSHYRYKTFKHWLDIGKIKCVDECVYELPEQIYVNNKMIGVQKGLYREEEGVNGFEERVISLLSNDDNVLFWHRNQERGKGFCINGFINHYPDFIVYLKSGQILLIETKGDDRDNSDSALKLELGKMWQNMSGERFRYYMVFDKKQIDGAKTVKDLLTVISEFDSL